jgi:hypothetical protein
MSDQKDAIVARVEAAYAAAYSTADPCRLGAIFTPKTTVQTEWGPILDGRGEITNGPVALFAAKPVPDALVNVPLLSRQLTADVIVSHGKALRRPPGGPRRSSSTRACTSTTPARGFSRRTRSRGQANPCARAASATENPVILVRGARARFAFGCGICWDAPGQPSVHVRRRGPRS